MTPIQTWRKAYEDKGIKLPPEDKDISFLVIDKPVRIVPITQAPEDQILADAKQMEQSKTLDEYRPLRR